MYICIQPAFSKVIGMVCHLQKEHTWLNNLSLKTNFDICGILETFLIEEYNFNMSLFKNPLFGTGLKYFLKKSGGSACVDVGGKGTEVVVT